MRRLPAISMFAVVALAGAAIAASHMAASGEAAFSSKVTVPMLARDGTTSPPTAIPTPTPTATPTQPPAAGVSVSKVSDYTDSIDFFHIIGEVHNGLGTAAQFVEVTAYFYSSTGTLLGTDFTFASLEIIPAGGDSPFELLSIELPPGTDHYEVAVTDYESPPFGNEPPVSGLSATVTNTYVDSIDFLHIVGTVHNGSATAYDFVQVIAALYGADGRVVRVDFTYADPDTLGPGQSGTFEIIVLGADEFSYSSYRLWVDGDRE